MRYQAKGLPWSSGIGKDVKDCTTSREVLEKAGLDFVVEKCPLVGEMPFSLNKANNEIALGDFVHNGRVYRGCPNAFATYRTDMNIPLGVVKSKYNVVQNSEAFKFFDDAIGIDRALWQTAGQFGFGEKVFISAKLPITTDVHGDEIDHYLVFSNSHDGSSSINIMFTPIRVFCTNCLNAGLESADSYIRIKHTKSAQEKLKTGAEILRIACEYAKDAQQLYNALYCINMSDEQVKQYLINLNLNAAERQALIDFDPKLGYDKLLRKDYLTLERTGISTRKANKIIGMWEYYNEGIGQQQIAGTAWGAYNAVTGYYSNVGNDAGEKRMDSLLYGGGFNSMQNAIVEAYELRNAS